MCVSNYNSLSFILTLTNFSIFDQIFRKYIKIQKFKQILYQNIIYKEFNETITLPVLLIANDIVVICGLVSCHYVHT